MIALLALVATAGWVVTCGAWRFQNVAAGIAYLEERGFPNLTTITVGTGGARENHDRLGPSIAIGGGKQIVLVDAGRGVAEALRKARIPVTQPRTVYLTSLLPENVEGLDDLLLTGSEAGRKEPLRVVGPAGTRDLTARLESAHAPGARALAEAEGRGDAGPRFDAVEIQDGFEHEQDGLHVRASALPGGPLPAFAYRFDAGPRSAVVSGVGWGGDALVSLAKGADTLVLEALHRASIDAAIEAGVADKARLEREAALHFSTEEVGVLAQRAGVHTLVLVRLRPPPLFAFQYAQIVARTFTGRVEIADDSDEITR